MAQTTQHPILKMEISDKYVCSQHLLAGGKVRVYLIYLGPSKGLKVKSVYNRGECHEWRPAEAISDAVGVSYFIVDVEVDFLQVCGPLLMAVILQFFLCLHELQWIMISVDDYLLPNNVMYPLAADLHNGVHFFVISRVLTDII
jgi:hypothetical protein